MKKRYEIAETEINKRKRAQSNYRERFKRARERRIRGAFEEGSAAALFEDEDNSSVDV